MHKVPRSNSRVFPKRRAGIFDKHAPYWEGQRAEDIVRERVEARAAARPARSKRAPGEKRPRGPKTKQQVLKRLERALLRRKTLAGRQRVKQRIAQLRRELDA